MTLPNRIRVLFAEDSRRDAELNLRELKRAVQAARDRPDRRKAEEKPAETQQRLRSIYESLPDVLWSVQLPSQRVTYVSPAAQAIFGHPPADFLADSTLWIDIVHAEDRAA